MTGDTRQPTTLLISPYFDAGLPSGGVLYSINVAREWLARGRGLHVLCAERDRSLGDLAPFARTRQLQLHPICTEEHTRFTHHVHASVERRARERIASIRPDVIHVHNFQGMLGAVRATIASPAPVMLTALDLGMRCLNFCYDDGTAVPCTGPDSVDKCVACIRRTIHGPAARIGPHLPRALTRRLWPRFVRLDQIQSAGELFESMRRILHGFDAIVALSPIVARELRRDGGDDLPIREIAHSIPAERIVRPTKTPSANVRLAYFGGGEPIKGLHVLVAAAEGLPDGLPLEITAFGGDAVCELIAEAPAQARRYLRVYPPVFGTALAQTHADIDAVLVPSLCHENSPYAVLEALANGTAVIASDQAGIRHLIDADRTGWLVEPGNPEAWASACQRAAESPTALHRMHQAARFTRTTADFVDDLEAWEHELLAEADPGVETVEAGSGAAV